MDAVTETKPDDVAPVAGLPDSAAPDATAPAQPDSDLDSLLEQFDKETAQPDPAPDLVPDGDKQQTTPTQDDGIADFLRELDGDKTRADGLQAEVDSLRAAEYQRRELEAFSKYADDLQQQLPSHLPPDYARVKMEALAHDPLLAAAWDLRGVDPNAAKLELTKIQIALGRLDPTADTARIAELNQYAQRLDIAINSAAILRKATLGILNEAKKLPKPYDEEATALQAEIAQSMRSGTTAKLPPEPPINYGSLSAAEGRQKVKEKFGFDPGWGH